MISTNITFDDGTTLQIQTSGGAAELAFYNFLSKPIERIRADIAERREYCCEQLKKNLGNHDLYPTPVYLSTADIESSVAKIGAYPGAKEPGYYEVYRLVVPEGRAERIVYMPMRSCPFCHRKPRGKG